MPIIDITAPLVEPVTIDEVKASARIEGTEFDGQIPVIIKSLRRLVETRIERRLITQTVELVLDAFPCGEIDLVLPDVQAITSIKYIDTNGTEQTLAGSAYVLCADLTPSLLRPVYGASWPSTREQQDAVRIRLTVGYGATAASVPDEVRYWIIAHAVQALQCPDGLVESSIKPLPYVDDLLNNCRVWRVA